MAAGGWIKPAATIAAGVLAAACLGKIAPVSTVVRAAFGLTPFTLGAAISLVTLLAAAASAPAGRWLRGRDPHPWLGAGLAVLAVSGAAMTVSAASPVVLICLRAGEGIGYLLIVVAGPAALAADVSRRSLPATLALWGACTPAGLAASAVAGGFAGTAAGWRGWFAALAAACAMLAPAFWAPAFWAPARRYPAVRPAGDAIRGAGLPRPLLLGCALAAMGSIAVAVISLLPAYLSLRFAVTPAAAGAATAAVAAASLPGNAAAAILLRRHVSPAALTCAVLLTPVLALAAFSPAIPLAAAIATAAALVLAIGVAASAVYASLPAVAPHPRDVPLANGILIQLASAGALAAPPLFAAVTGLRHWELAGYLVIPAAIAAVAAMMLATRKRQAPAAAAVLD